tara:strand:- start:114 stop:2246 length:2133 start_codon:yes stop_codon:yes gene_type:complete
MANYYIISIDPLINTFSSIKSGTEFDFSIETEDTNIKEQEIISGDKILVHLDDTVYYNLEVISKSLDHLKLKKIFEIEKSIDERIAETGSFQEITKEEFDAICSKLFSEYNLGQIEYINEIENELEKIHAKIIYGYLKEGKSHRVIEDEYLNIKNNGYSAMETLHEYDIDGNKKNILNTSDFKNEFSEANGNYKKGLQLLLKYYSSEFRVFNIDVSQLNTILYGPPGTGKTYSTVDKVVKIISPSSYQEENHTANKLEYDTLYKKRHILFTTFHQSMSYEDFVEGIKPKIQDESDEEKEELTYEISSGIFKIACARAAYNSYKENKITSQTSYSFEDVYQAFIEMALSHIAADDFINCKTITGKDVEIYRINKNDSIKARATGSNATHVAPLTKENIQKLYDTYNSIDEIKNLQQIKDTVGVSPRLTEFYAVFRSLLEFKQTTFQPIKDEEVVEKELNDDEIVRQFDAGLYTKSVKEFGKFSTPIVLVIDEINRGNVSAIFGELITLIEGDKRIGQANEIQLILPYSKVPFSVPPNLFILGTMNTADRSVEALDTALRRRFNFEEMMPDPSLLKTRGDGKGIVAEFKLWKILKTINERIEVLIDRDHTIGHAYLWDVKTITDLKLAFHNKIIPLLQEYFFGNYAKMELVIGAKFFNQKKKNKTIDFAVRNSELDIEPGTRYELLNIQEFSDGEMKTAISNLLVEEPKDDE